MRFIANDPCGPTPSEESLAGLGLLKSVLPAGLFSRFLMWMLFGCLAGCVSAGRGGSSGGAVGEIHLFGVPVTLTAPGKSAPAGIGVRIYASAQGGSRGIPIRKGVLEVLMFDGPVPEGGVATQTPLKIWSFSPEQLRAYTDVSFLGDGYQLALPWEKSVPKSRIITVAARYRNGSGGVLYSAPGAISVSGRAGELSAP